MKNSYFSNRSKESLNINCEKDFAYVEEKNTESTAMENNGKENLLGYKLYLNKEGDKSESSSIKDENLWDLTVANATNNNFAAVLNASNKEQQTIAAAIEPNPRNQLTPNAPTMITRSTKEQRQEENTLSNNMVKTND